MRDYKKVQIQLENLETSVRDRCKKEFTGTNPQFLTLPKSKRRQNPNSGLLPPFCPSDLMTEMMDMSSDLVGSGIPFLDYRAYAERIFFPGHQESPLRRDLDVPESRRQTVEQGLVQLSNLLNSKLFLTKVGQQNITSPFYPLHKLGTGGSPVFSLLSLFTPSRSSGRFPPGTGRTWPLC